MFHLSRATTRVLTIVSMLGTAAAGVALYSGASAQQAAGGLVNPPGVSISREPLNTNPATWVGCNHVAKGGPNGVPGMLCAPSIQTGDPAKQAALRAQRDAYAAANPQPAGGRGGAVPAPQEPVACGPNPYAPPAPAPAAGRGPARPPQGGRGPIRVAFVTKGHEYEREQLAQMLDCLGQDITYSHVEYPAAELILNAQAARSFDVYVFFDLGGPGVGVPGPNGETGYRFYPDPSPALKRGFEAMLKSGTAGIVFIHHAAAAWAHTWPEYSEAVGGACDWYAPVTVRGILDPHHGFYGNTNQVLTVVDRNHPLAQNLPPTFNVTDEAYACAWFPESVKPFVTTSFSPPDPLVNLNPKRQFSNLAAWYKASENTPVFYTQVGHGNSPWRVAEYQLMIRNAIRWAASPEAHAWARANRTRIWK